MPPSANSRPSNATGPEGQAAASLHVAGLLAFTGGVLDAFLYVVHGGVFAGAMTGNVVLCGLALGTRNWHEILRHSLPLLAFVVGVLLSEFVQSRWKHHAISLCLLVEATGLLVASLLPRAFPDPAYVFAVCLLAAFQIATFSMADSFSYSSTYITGDLRTLAIGLFKLFRPATRAEGRHQTRDLGCVVGSFLLGAVTGALLGARYGNRTLWLPVVCLLTVWLLISQKAGAGRRADQPGQA